MDSVDLQSLCALGQKQLVEMDYLAAEATLVQADHLATERRDFDTLARLYLPLQEARRQRRQRCGEAIVRLDILASSPADQPDGREIVAAHPHGQLLVAGWGSIEPALRIRQLQHEQNLYVETFLAAIYPIGSAGRAVVIVPTSDVTLPQPSAMSIDELMRKLPAHCIVMNENELPRGPRRGDWHTYAETMAMWERLHAPFLAAADMQVDPLLRIEGYRKAIRVDYACELAHQRLSDTARSIARATRGGPTAAARE